VWYTVVLCTSGTEGAGLAPANTGASVFLVLHGRRGSSQRVKLPSQQGDFEQGQEDVFRCAAPVAVIGAALLAAKLEPAAEEAQLYLHPCL
jgi:hypothetical protein